MSRPRVLLATGNAKKLAELRRIVDEQGLELDVVSKVEAGDYPDPAETEWTFEGNALIKARAGVAATGLPTLADDSGLAVDALGGMPGVRSSRWAGPDHDDQANLELVLRQIDDVDADRRGAQFVAVVALALPDGREFTVRGEMPGTLALAPRGTNGFGYDPIMVPDDQVVEPGAEPRSSAELSPAEKDAISHRGKALRAMLATLVEELGLKRRAAAESEGES